MPAPEPDRVIALIVAAGRGVRAGGGLPKQYRTVGGKAILRRTAELFLAHPRIGRVAIVIHPDDAALYEAAVGDLEGLLPPLAGGSSRQDSVLRGLEALSEHGAEHVLIHDAVRPFASAALIDRVLDALGESDAALAASPVTDTLKRSGGGPVVAETVAREGLHAAETPQGFRFTPILDAHRRAAAAGIPVTDDASIAEWAGMTVRLVPGERSNAKLTTPEDIAIADERLSAAPPARETRVGTGYDVHPFTEGDAVWLGGIRIPYDKRLAGHSDADVALHALTDAVLGAIADGDIGVHFPPSDLQWKGASSDRFLAYAIERARARGARIVHLDLAIVAEAPKIGPHRDAMRARIAEIAGIDIGRVAVKATTNEKLGFIGRGEGIAAIGTATLSLPAEE